ncbi:MAG: ABC transporter ATP-binding protein [Candidatus Edwardsbacteria bacterium]
MIAIQTRNLRKQYSNLLGQKKTLAVNGIDLEIGKGEIFGLLGPNGAGKTTTVKMIAGLVRPTAGDIYVNGFHLKDKRRKALASIGAVLEGTRNVYWRLTPQENLIYFANLKGKRTKEVKNRIDELLRLFDLREKTKEVVQKLSRGMQQKVAIAVALVANPEILLLDEPTLGLDVESAQIVKERLKEIVSHDGKTILLTTHQMEVAEELCDRVAIINKGKIVACDSVRNLIRLFSVEEYRFIISGKLTPEQKEKFSHFTLTQIEEDSYTTVDVTLRQPSEIYEIMDIFRQANSKIISLDKLEPDLEKVFLEIVRGGK